jgi:anaerobic selenocysteine-containing dehydrogenase
VDHPPVKAMVVYNSNPAAIAPNQNLVLRGMRRDDLFTAVLEQFQTDTADHADILLPATTFLEHTDIYLSYGHYHLQLARPVIDPPGEARSNVDVFRALAERMGFDDPCFRDSDDDMLRTSGRGTFRSSQRRRTRHAVSAIRARRIRYRFGQMRVRRRASSLHAARRIAPGRSETAQTISPGNAFLEKRRQHEFDLRQSRRRGCANRRIADASR